MNYKKQITSNLLAIGNVQGKVADISIFAAETLIATIKTDGGNYKTSVRVHKDLGKFKQSLKNIALFIGCTEALLASGKGTMVNHFGFTIEVDTLLEE